VTGPPSVLLAVSAGTDPTGEWAFQKLPAGADDYAEFPLVGYNGRWIVVTSNLISGSTGYLSGSAIWAIEKASLAAGGAPSVSRFTLKSPGSPIAPVVTLDGDQPDELLLQQDTDTGGHRRLRVFRVTDSAGQATLTSAVMATAPLAWNAMPAPLESLPQAGTTRRIISDQDEVSSACLRNGTIWAVQTAALPGTSSAPAHTVIQWWKLAPDARVLGFSRVEGPAGTWLGFPSIAVNAEDEVLIGYSLFSGGSFASAGYSLRSRCDTDEALTEIHVLKAGEAPYDRLDGGGHNRWGDLSQTVADPDNVRLWTLQEYAAAPEEGNSRWGTWWGGFTRAASSRAGACVAPASAASPTRVGARANRQP